MSRAKPIPHSTAACRDNGIFEVNYDDDNTPWLKCSNCGKIVDDWRRWRDEYSKYWEDATRWSNKRDHLMCLLGYFAHQYISHYGVGFTFSLNDRGLFNGKEVFCIRKAYAMLGNDVALARSYIDWIFSFKVDRKRKKITSLSFLAVPELVQEFRLYHQKSRRVTRDRALPQKMVAWVSENIPEILNHVSLRDFGELRMALAAYRSGHIPESANFNVFVDKLVANNIIDSEMNIGGWSE
jgi:hypothetical protein